MASIALGIAGAGIGSFFGNPMLGFSVGMTVGGLLFPQKQPGRGKLDDLRVTGSGWGVSIPRVWGNVRLGGNVIWSTDLVEHSTSNGGKGGPSVQSFTYTVSCAVLICEGPVASLRKIWANNDVLIYDATATPTSKYTIRFYDGTQTLPDSYMDAHQDGGGKMPAFKKLSFVMLQDFELTDFGNRMPSLNFEIFQGDATAESILTDLATLAGMTSDAYDFSAVSAVIVNGMVSAERDAAKTIADPLLDVYSLDLTEVDGKLKAFPRGAGIAATIAAADLGAQDWPVGDLPETRLESTIGQDLELPRTLDLTYFSPTANYEQATQSAYRTTKGDLQQVETVNTPLSLFDDEARRAAERLLYLRWITRFTHKFSLPFSYLRLIPASQVLLPVGALLKRARITSIDVGFIGLLKLTAVEDDDAGGIYCQGALGAATNRGLPALQAIKPVTFYAWSGTELQDAHKAHPGFYVVGTWDTGGSGGQIFFSFDGGTTYVPSFSVTSRSDWGHCTSILANGGTPDTWDTNILDVHIIPPGTLASASQAEVFASYTNAALVGEEITGFQTAALIGATPDPNDYELTNFLRGRRASAMSGHSAPDEVFVHLSSAGVVRVTVDPSFIGSTVRVKVVAPGDDIALITPVVFTIATPTP